VIIPKLRFSLHSAGSALTSVCIFSFFSFFVVLFALSSTVLGSAQRQAKPEKPYALIFGTVWGPDDHPLYGVSVKIRRASDKPKKVRWELYSDHNGEFAQRVPAGEADYILWADLKGFKFVDGRPLHLAKEVTLHIYNDERQDTGLHLTY
jgi:hypothetical protein